MKGFIALIILVLLLVYCPQLLILSFVPFAIAAAWKGKRR